MVKIIGLTGPIGVGKNTVARILQKNGAEIIDVDKLAHTLYVPQLPLWQELVRAFGSKILKRGGEVNRKKLGGIVFADKKKLQILNRIVHPYLKQAIVDKLKNYKLSVVNAALPQLFEELADEVWVVTAPYVVRLKRLIKKGLDKKTAIRRMQGQMGPKDYLKIADVVIENKGKLKDLIAKLTNLRAT